MSDSYLVKYCAPTMAGIKTGSLFTCDFESRKELIVELKRYNGILAPNGLFLIPLKIMGSKVLLYLFRKKNLAEDLAETERASFLENLGYPAADYRKCLLTLIRKMKHTEGFRFPHEIGLFLSYPPEDVRGFVENRAESFKAVGYWKVYGDEKAARRTFSRYDRCTLDYSIRIKKGDPLEELIVPGN